MSLVELTEFLVKSITKEPDMVSVKEYIEEDESLRIEIVVANDDMGAVIGKGGNTINSIRTLVQASAYTNKLPKVKINVDSF